jgi:hypothetical protein
MPSAFDFLLRISSPYTYGELEKFRLSIMQEMKRKGFNHYVQQMKQLSADINDVMRNETYLLDNDYWKNKFHDVPYWHRESPELLSKFQWKRLFRLGIHPTGLTTITNIMLRKKYVDQLIGNAYWMTEQQIILFKTIISTYFTTNIRLWPVHLNMDFTFLSMRKKLQVEKLLPTHDNTTSSSRHDNTTPSVRRAMSLDEEKALLEIEKEPDAVVKVQSPISTDVENNNASILSSRSQPRLLPVLPLSRKKPLKNVPNRRSKTRVHEKKTKNQKMFGASMRTSSTSHVFTPTSSSPKKSTTKSLPVVAHEKLQEIKTRVKVNVDKGMILFKQLSQSLLAGSGPFILKMLQQINTNNNSKIDGTLAVSDLTSDIFTNVPGLTTAEYDLFFSAIDIPEPYLKHMNKKILGSASIAEAHETFSDEFNSPAILKFIKPLYAYYFLCECDYLLVDAWKAIAKNAASLKDLNSTRKFTIQCRRLLMFFIQEFTKEFDYQQEFENTTIGFEIYNQPNGPVKSTMVFEHRVDPFPYLILQKMNGQSLDAILKTKNIKHRMADIYDSVDTLNRIWVKETIWGSGFFHADIHPGNVIVNDNDEIALIDYGSCGILSKTQQCNLISSMIQSGRIISLTPQQLQTREGQKQHQQNVQHAEKFVKIIWNLCSVNKYTKEHLNQVTYSILDYPAVSFGELFLKMIRISDDIGTCSNDAILLFGRGIAYLGVSIKAVSESCDDVNICPTWALGKIIQQNMLKHPGQIARFLFTGRACV